MLECLQLLFLIIPEFAALQTTMSDLTSDLEGGNVLFRDFDVYATKILFMEASHPALTPPVIMVIKET